MCLRSLVRDRGGGAHGLATRDGMAASGIWSDSASACKTCLQTLLLDGRSDLRAILSGSGFYIDVTYKLEMRPSDPCDELQLRRAQLCSETWIERRAMILHCISCLQVTVVVMAIS